MNQEATNRGPVMDVEGTLIPYDRIADLLTSAFEGGSNYWIEDVQYDGPNEGLPFRPWDMGGMPRYVTFPLSEGFTVMVNTDEETLRLDLEAVKRGLMLMQRKYPRRWKELIALQDDAETADVFLQLALFGSVVYG